MWPTFVLVCRVTTAESILNAVGFKAVRVLTAKYCKV